MSTIMKISPQGQIRIPKKILQTLDIEKGDYVEVEVEKGHILLRRNGKKWKLRLTKKSKNTRYHPSSKTPRKQSSG